MFLILLAGKQKRGERKLAFCAQDPVELRRGQPMQIGKPLRTVIVEPLELPVKEPTAEPEPVSVPEPDQEPVPVLVPIAQ